MDEIYIFGASNFGEVAYKYLKENNRIEGFIDNDLNKQGQLFCGLPIYSLDAIRKLNKKIIIASSYWREIEKQLIDANCYDYQIFNVQISKPNLRNSALITNNLTSVSAGALIASIDQNMVINDLTFSNGGSTVMDYFFLKAVAIKQKTKTFLEIGTWTGESVTSIADIADHCYSISLPDNDQSMIDVFDSYCNKDNFSRYFSRKKKNIINFEEDSLEFDYNKIPRKIDLVFIDGDHSYQGISQDTKNIFEKCGFEEAIIVWHDFKTMRNELVQTTYEAVNKNIPLEYKENLYAVQGNYCGIYIPEKYKRLFVYEEDRKHLYSYTVDIGSKLNKLEV